MAKIYDVAILGGGASGMMAAIHAAMEGVTVVILECNDSLGRKLLATGNGRCNFSNVIVDETGYLSDDIFVNTLFEGFSGDDTLDFFMNIGIIPIVKDGRLYPSSNQANSILTALTNQIKQLGIEVRNNFKVQKVDFETMYKVTSSEGRSIIAKTVVLAMGGKASEIRGSNGDGYFYAQKFGHTVEDLYPALVPLVIGKFDPILSAAGSRCPCRASLFIDDYCIASEEGELQITSTGLSGIMIFQLSNIAAEELDIGNDVVIELDFIPHIAPEDFAHYLIDMTNNMPRVTIQNFLKGILPEAIATALFPDSFKTLAQIDENLFEEICLSIKEYRTRITDTAGFKAAQVTGGGISLDEIDPKTCESKLQLGFYITGEIMDVNGLCGGYNLQWAWSSGAVAGRAAAKKALEQ